MQHDCTNGWGSRADSPTEFAGNQSLWAPVKDGFGYKTAMGTTRMEAKWTAAIQRSVQARINRLIGAAPCWTTTGVSTGRSLIVSAREVGIETTEV